MVAKARNVTPATQEQALAELVSGFSPVETTRLQHAFEAAQLSQRAQGAPPAGLAVAAVLKTLQMDCDSIAAAIVHASGLTEQRSLHQLADCCGPAVVGLVEGLRKLEVIGTFRDPGKDDATAPKQVERLRKLLLTMVEDVRVVVVKLAEQLHALRTARQFGHEVRQRIAAETLDVYAPLASRLGIWQIKWEMEDLAFREIDAETYKTIAHRLDERRAIREQYIERVVGELDAKLQAAGIEAEVSGRPKHIYSIWRKMTAKGLSFDQVFDLRAVRILVDDVASCYAALGIVHTVWPHVPTEFDDYITNPKANRYQSLHTAVIGPEGKTLEAQIRTKDMHAHAELGIAAHWRYKEGGAEGDRDVEAKIAWLREVLESRDEAAQPEDFLEHLNVELLSERVYAVTPKGTILDLPAGATPLDFAYQIHTDIGHRCRGAKVNGAIVPLTYALKSGERVEIITARQPGPSRDWLNPHLAYLKSGRARAKVRHWFKQLDFEKNLADGQALFDREIKRLGLSGPAREPLLKRFNFASFDDLLAAIGRGEVSTARLAGALQHALPPKSLVPRKARARKEVARGGVQISGVGNLLTQIAKCCKPVPPEAIVGYITRGRGVTVHRRDCPGILRLALDESARLIDVGWGESGKETYAVELVITGYDRQGLLHDVTVVVSNEKVNVTEIDSKTRESDQTVLTRMTLEVTDLEQLSRIIDRLSQLSHVVEVRRSA